MFFEITKLIALYLICPLFPARPLSLSYPSPPTISTQPKTSPVWSTSQPQFERILVPLPYLGPGQALSGGITVTASSQVSLSTALSLPPAARMNLLSADAALLSIPAVPHQ